MSVSDIVNFTPTDEQIEAIIEVTDDKDAGAGLALLWEMMLGKPLSAVEEPIKVSLYRIPQEAHDVIYKRSLNKISKLYRNEFMFLWLDKGPGVIRD